MNVLTRTQPSTIDFEAPTFVARKAKTIAAVGIVFAIVASSGLLLGAQQAVPPSNAAPIKAEPAVPFVASSPAAPHTPGTEGIKIHGHWVIDIKNADGSIAEHRDFENALVPSQGGSLLAGLLLGRFSPQTFDVVLAGSGKTALLYLNGQTCPQGLVSGPSDCSATLTQDSLGGSSIVLRSSYAPTAALTITTVSTGLGTCPTTAGGATPVSPATCQATTNGPIPGAGGAYVGTYNFTAATIPDLIVSPGQTVALTVTISFS